MLSGGRCRRSEFLKPMYEAEVAAAKERKYSGKSTNLVINLKNFLYIMGTDVMLCPERARLLKTYIALVDSYRKAVAAIQDSKDAADFEEAYLASEKLRLAADSAREVMECHRRQHHC